MLKASEIETNLKLWCHSFQNYISSIIAPKLSNVELTCCNAFIPIYKVATITCYLFDLFSMSYNNALFIVARGIAWTVLFKYWNSSGCCIWCNWWNWCILIRCGVSEICHTLFRLKTLDFSDSIIMQNSSSRISSRVLTSECGCVHKSFLPIFDALEFRHFIYDVVVI